MSNNPRKTKRLSGYEYRKNKVKREEERNLLNRSLRKFLTPTNTNTDNPTDDNTTDLIANAVNTDNEIISTSNDPLPLPSCSGIVCFFKSNR